MKSIYIAAISLLLIGLAAADTQTSVNWNIEGDTFLAQNYVGGHTFDAAIIDNLGTTNGFFGTFATPNTVAGQSGIDAEGRLDFEATGVTDFVENMVEGGLNWQNDGSGWTMGTPTDVATAYIFERITNEGSLDVVKQFENPFDWKLMETKAVSGTGDTTIGKKIGWWTNSLGGQATQVQADVTFKVPLDSVSLTGGLISTDTKPAQPGLSTFPIVDTIYGLCTYDAPTTGINTWSWAGQTDNPFTFTENVWINPQLP